MGRRHWPLSTSCGSGVRKDPCGSVPSSALEEAAACPCGACRQAGALAWVAAKVEEPQVSEPTFQRRERCPLARDGPQREFRARAPVRPLFCPRRESQRPVPGPDAPFERDQLCRRGGLGSAGPERRLPARLTAKGCGKSAGAVGLIP